jgi:hypothetical protein
MSLKNWNVVAASNNSAPPNGAPENTMLLKDVNDVMRAMMADVRTLAASDTIASATTTDLGSKDATFLTVSGVVTITGLGTVSAGIYKHVIFSGALTLTHNATSLILPGATNITTVAGDAGLFLSLGSGNWRCLAYQPVGGYAKLASPTFTGTPAAPTAVAGTNTTQLATTAFVAALGALKANIAIQAVQTPTLLNSWVNRGGGFTSAGYWKDNFGVVHLVGTVTGGTANTVVFTLPAGYRPAENVEFAVTSLSGATPIAYGEIYVESNGDVSVNIGSTTNLSLNGISFRTT